MFKPPKPPKQKNPDDPLEAKIETEVCKYARKKGMRAYKFKSQSNRGVPDRITLFKYPHMVFIEYKRKGREPTPQQAERIAEIRELGWDVYVIDNIEEGKKLIDSVIRNAAT